MATHILIEGVVQGVGFRAWFEAQAQSRRLRGWVRNLEDGRVEAWLEGDADAIADMVTASRDGPRRAEVARLEAHEAPDEGRDGFEVRRTAPSEDAAGQR